MVVIAQEATGRAISAAVAASANAMLVRWDVVLEQPNLRPVAVARARVAPFSGQHLMGPDPEEFDVEHPKLKDQHAEGLRWKLWRSQSRSYCDFRIWAEVTWWWEHTWDFSPSDGRISWARVAHSGPSRTGQAVMVGPSPNHDPSFHGLWHQEHQTRTSVSSGQSAQQGGCRTSVLNFMATFVPRDRMRLRPIQWWAKEVWFREEGHWSDMLWVTPSVLHQVAWWESLVVFGGVRLSAQEVELTLFTDASCQGWGAQLGGHSLQGTWSDARHHQHINMLKLETILCTARGYLPVLCHHIVHLMGDNAMAVAYIRKEGGTQSFKLTCLAIRVLQFCDRMDITLHAVFLLGARNIMADALSCTERHLWQSGLSTGSCWIQCSPDGGHQWSTFSPLLRTRSCPSVHHHSRTPGPSTLMRCQSLGPGLELCMPYHHSGCCQWSSAWSRELTASQWSWSHHGWSALWMPDKEMSVDSHSTGARQTSSPITGGGAVQQEHRNQTLPAWRLLRPSSEV